MSAILEHREKQEMSLQRAYAFCAEYDLLQIQG